MQSVSVRVREKGRPADAMRACSREAWRQPGLFERAHLRLPLVLLTLMLTWFPHCC